MKVDIEVPSSMIFRDMIQKPMEFDKIQVGFGRFFTTDIVS
jgi:hypothetical protein